METLKPKIELRKEGNDYVLVVHNCRTMYANVSQPRTNDSGEATEYSCDFLVPKDAEGMEAVKAEIRTLGTQKFGGPGWKCPVLKDGDRTYNDFVEQGGDKDDKMKLAIKGHYVISANTKMRDRSTGALIAPITKGIIYSGCFASAKANIKPYDFTDKQTGSRAYGIKGYLNGVVFKADGEPLGRQAVSLDDLGEAGVSAMAPAAGPDDFSYAPPTNPPAATEPDPW